jgi:hypothetical protein
VILRHCAGCGALFRCSFPLRWFASLLDAWEVEHRECLRERRAAA